MERYIRSSVNGHSTNFLVEDPSWAKDFVKKGLAYPRANQEARLIML